MQTFAWTRSIIVLSAILLLLCYLLVWLMEKNTTLRRNVLQGFECYHISRQKLWKNNQKTNGNYGTCERLLGFSNSGFSLWAKKNTQQLIQTDIKWDHHIMSDEVCLTKITVRRCETYYCSDDMDRQPREKWNKITYTLQIAMWNIVLYNINFPQVWTSSLCCLG